MYSAIFGRYRYKGESCQIRVNSIHSVHKFSRCLARPRWRTWTSICCCRDVKNFHFLQILSFIIINDIRLNLDFIIKYYECTHNSVASNKAFALNLRNKYVFNIYMTLLTLWFNLKRNKFIVRWLCCWNNKFICIINCLHFITLHDPK